MIMQNMQSHNFQLSVTDWQPWESVQIISGWMNFKSLWWANLGSYWFRCGWAWYVLRTSTSVRAWMWTPHFSPCSTSSESKVSIRMILFKPGVSSLSTLPRSTFAFSGLSQTTTEISAVERHETRCMRHMILLTCTLKDCWWREN